MSSNLIGSLIWLLFIFLSVFSHMIIKSLTGDVDFIITLFARFVYSLPILFILAFLARKIFFLQINHWSNIFIRSLFGFVTMIMVCDLVLMDFIENDYVKFPLQYIYTIHSSVS